MQLKIFYDHGQTFKTVRFEDSITVQEAIRRFAERTPLYTTADPTLYGFYLPETYPYLSSYPSPPATHASNPSTPPPSNNTSASAPTTPQPTTTPASSDDTDRVGWLENDRLLSSYNIKDFLLFKKKTSLYPRKITSNFTLTKIHLPTSDKTLKYDTKMTVKEAIHYLKSRNPGVDMTNFGLYLPYSPHDTDGFFLEEDRTISSYDLDYQAELHFIPRDKKVTLSEFTILFTKKQVRKKMQLNSDITLQNAMEKLVSSEPYLVPTPSLYSIDSSSIPTEKYGFYMPPYDDGIGKFQEANTSVLHLTHGHDPFVVYQPIKETEDETLAHGELVVEVHVVAPNGGFSKFFQRQTMWASKTGVSLKVKVDEETTVHELRELVKKMLLAQKAQWASVISDYGVYLPHQTDGESLLDDDTPIISTPIPPVGTQFELKPVKRVESFMGDISSGIQVIVHQYNTRAQNKLILPVDRTATIGLLKEHIFDLMGSRLSPDQATDYVLARPSIVDDGELFEDDSRDLNSYKIDLNTVLEFRPRAQYPVPESPLMILSVSITTQPPPSLDSTIFIRPTDIHLRLPVHSRSITVSQIIRHLREMLRNMNNPNMEQTIQNFNLYSLFWQDANLWLSPTRSIISYGIPPAHTVLLQVKPIGIYIRVWNYQIPQTLGYFQYPPNMLVADIDKKDLFNMVRSDPNSQKSRNRTVSIYNPPSAAPKTTMDVDLDTDIYGFYCIPEKQIGGPEDITEKPFWLDATKTIKECGVYEGSVVELKPMPQPLNVIGRNSVTVQFDMDKPIADYLPIPVEKNDKVIWQKEPHNPSGLLLDPSQSLSSQGIRPYYGACILLTRQSQNKAKHEDNSIEGQIKRDLWEELRAAEPEGLVLNGDQVIAGTVNRLIEQLTSSKVHDLAFMKTFLLTYQAFVTPRIFFTKLVERYHVPAPDTTDIGNFVENVQRPIQLRVCNVLKKTIDLNFSDFDNVLLQDMNQFLETVLIPSNNAGLAHKIQKSLMKNMQAATKPKVNPSVIFDRSPPTSRIGNVVSPIVPQTLVDYDELEIARQLTILEYENYYAIEPTELLNQAWCKPKLMHRSPNILKMISRFNGISSWVTGVIIEPEDIKNRVKVFKKVVNIGKHLLELNSLNALMALIAGVLLIFRHIFFDRNFKYTKKELSRKTQEDMTHLETLMNSEGSYKKYRAYLHSANPPQIPYIGIYLSDLTFIEEGNDDTVRGLVNFEKMRMMCNVILELQQYQQQPYNLTRIPELSDMLQKELTAAATVDEAPRYQKSLLREPRGASRDEIR